MLDATKGHIAQYCVRSKLIETCHGWHIRDTRQTGVDATLEQIAQLSCDRWLVWRGNGSPADELAPRRDAVAKVFTGHSLQRLDRTVLQRWIRVVQGQTQSADSRRILESGQFPRCSDTHIQICIVAHHLAQHTKRLATASVRPRFARRNAHARIVISDGSAQPFGRSRSWQRRQCTHDVAAIERTGIFGQGPEELMGNAGLFIRAEIVGVLL